MQTDMSMSQGIYAWSPDADEGTVTFSFDVPCEGTYYVWGVVWDNNPGAHSYDPDSFYGSMDMGKESQWIYGCQTWQFNEPTWSWQRVRHDPDASNGCDDNQDVSYMLTAGPHTYTLRNREGATMSGLAAVARILVTNDAQLVPDLQNY
jgi:hypothetical protein